ncbi:MAG: hypothetical protein HN582_07465 [Marinovum sp.]|nr:hypothetical protein [Marinovum sp.]
MSKGKSPGRRGECLKPIDLSLLDSPLDFMAEDHLRTRKICALIDQVAASNGTDHTDVKEVMFFLRDEFPLQMQDKTIDLFPMMHSRCKVSDEIDSILDRLQFDHGEELETQPKLTAVLENLLAGQAEPRPKDWALLVSFAKHVRRHLIVENAILLPIARARLSASDLGQLRDTMQQRRQLNKVVE